MQKKIDGFTLFDVALMRDFNGVDAEQAALVRRADQRSAAVADRSLNLLEASDWRAAIRDFFPVWTSATGGR